MSSGRDPNASSFDVGYIAHLARVQLEEAESARLQQQLEHILRYVEELKKVDVSGIEPMATSVTARNVLRPDEVQPGLEHDDAMSNAPATRQGQFLVPRILE